MTPTAADLVITKADATDPIEQGANQVYTVQVDNNGPGDALNVVVTDVLDANTVYVSDTAPSGCTEAPAGTLTCNLGTLVASGTLSFDIVATVDAAAPSAGGPGPHAGPCAGGEDLCNSVSVVSTSPNPAPGDDSDSEPTDVTVAQADLVITKSDDIDPIDQGATLTYTIQVDNNGPDTANNVVVTDVLEANTTYVSDTAPSGCTEAPVGTLTCALGAIAAAGNVSFDIVTTVSATAPTAGGPGPMTSPCTGAEDLCNTASVTSSTAEAAPGDETADEPTDATIPQADLTITKVDDIDPIDQGATLTYTIQVDNNGPDAAQNVVITDVLDSDTTYVSDTFPSGCTEAPAGTLTCNVGTLAALGTVNFDVVVTVSPTAPTAGGPGPLTSPCTGAEDICNTVSVASSTADPSPGDESADEPSDVTIPVADLVITKVDDIDPIDQGATLTYTIQLDNNGPDAAQNVVITDVLDSNTTYVSDTFPSGWTEAPVGTLTCNVGTLAALGTVNFDVVVTVSPTAPTAGGPGPLTSPCTGAEDICNTVSVVSSTADAAPGDESADEPSDVTIPQADLSITKVDDIDPIDQSATLTYTIQVDNNGPDAAQNVVITDTLDANTTYVSDTFPGGCTEAPVGTLTCTVGSLAASGSVNFDVVVTVADAAPTAGGPGPMAGSCGGAEDICNTVAVTSDTADPAPGDETADSPTDVTIPDVDLVITKVDDVDPVDQGGVLTYTIQLDNNGPDDARNVVITDVLDADTTYVSDTFPGGCTEAPAGTLTCNVGALAALGQVTFDVTVNVSTTAATAGGVGPMAGPCTGTEDLCNNVSMVSDDNDVSPGDESDSEPTDVRELFADLSITKVDGADPVARGDSLTYTLSVTNNGPDLAYDVVVTDTLDANTTFVSDTFPGGCTEAPAGTLTCNIGTLAASASSDFTVTVSVNANAPVLGGPGPHAGPCAGGEDLCNTATVTSVTTDAVPGNETASEPTDVSLPVVDLSITKTELVGDPVGAGGPLTYRLPVVNTGPDAAEDVVVTDVLDSQTTYSSDTFPSGCTESPVGTLTCSLGTFPVGTATFDIFVDVSPSAQISSELRTGACDGSEDLCNTVAIATSSNDTDLSNNSDDEPTDVVAGLSISKAETPDTVRPGETLTYTLVYANATEATLTDVQVVETYDANTTFVSAVPPPDVGNDTWNLGSLAPGQSGTITIVMNVSDALTEGSALNNVASVTAAGGRFASAPENTLLSEAAPDQARLDLEKVILSETIAAGGTIDYRLVVRNMGQATSYSTVVRDVLPASLTFVSSDPSPSSVSGKTVEWNVGNLALGESQTIDLTVVIDPALPDGFLIDNDAETEGSTGPGTSAGAGLAARRSNAIAIGGAGGPGDRNCELILTKRSVGIPIPGEQVVYRLLFCDPCKDAHDVVSVDFLPEEVETVSVTTPEEWTYSATPDTVTFDIGSLPAGRSARAYITVKIDDDAVPGSLVRNTITATDRIGRTATATDEMIVKNPAPGGAANAAYVRVSGPKQAKNGKKVTFRAKYDNVLSGSTMTALMSEDIEITQVIPPSGFISGGGQAITWVNLPSTKGNIKIKGIARVNSPDVVGTLLRADVAIHETSGSVYNGGFDTMVRIKGNGSSGGGGGGGNTGVARLPTLSIGGSRTARPGRALSLKVRYKNVSGAGSIVISLPDGLSYAGGLPAPTSVDGSTITWSNMTRSSGSIRISVDVDPTLAEDTSLPVTGLLSDNNDTDDANRTITVR